MRMRSESRLTTWLAMGLAGLLVAMPVRAEGRDAKRQRRRPAAEPRQATRIQEEMLALLRGTRAAAEAAMEEARQARRQAEALQQQLDRASQELAALRQQNVEFGARMADLKGSLENFQAATAVTAKPAPAEPAAPPASEERLSRLEEEVDVHTSQLKEQAQTKVEADSRFRVRLTGMLLMNTYLNSDDDAGNDLPIFAFPAAARAGRRRNNLGASMRQTRIGFSMTGPRVGNARLSAEADFDFWGGPFRDRIEGDVLGFLRIRTASAKIEWDRGAIEVGQLAPLISPLNPTSLAAVWFPGMTGAGNLWQWRPQILGERRARLGPGTELIFQGALLPVFGETVGGSDLQGSPAFQGRVALRRALEDERVFEIGIGGHREKRHFGVGGQRVDGAILSGDWRIPLGSRLELSGEAYRGRAVSLSEPSGSRIDRLFAYTGILIDPATVVRGVRSGGGWLQLSLQARPDLEFNAAYGQEDPNNADLRFGVVNGFTRFKNQAVSANFIHHLRSNFLISLEYRRLLTEYATGRRTNNHVNLAFGYLF
ncbi:MAG: hypothetical protein SF339_12150 [Blastocatellia bacterium]|nr:hypothetical protein [Blastocatellia bacterium]